MKKKGLFINLKYEIKISKTNYCPPHYLPHKLPFGKKITNESCHIHKKKWRMNHNIPFCRKLKCPHYKFMIKKYKEYLAKN
jgi:hypothetical protein